jgi:hypothetical protein
MLSRDWRLQWSTKPSGLTPEKAAIPSAGRLRMAAGARAGTVEVLYISLERPGALTEIGFRLPLEPDWPSRIEHECTRSPPKPNTRCTSPTTCGIDISRYESFDYGATQAVAAAAHFLEFDGLLVPSARHRSHNLVIFTDRGAAGSLTVRRTETVNWSAWRRTNAEI